MRTTWLVAVVGLGGCGEVTFQDEGLVCVGGDTTLGPVVWDPGDPLPITVQIEGCLPCGATDVVTTCSVDVAGDEITVHSDGSYRQGAALACDESCLRVRALCDTPPIEPGTWTVVHGDDRVSVLLPDDLATCFGR